MDILYTLNLLNEYSPKKLICSTDWGIDKDAFSGKFFPVTSLSTEIYLKPDKPSNAGKTTIFSLIDSVYALEQLYATYFNDNIGMPLSPEILTLGVTNFLRSQKYFDIAWDGVTLRLIDYTFIQYVQDSNPSLFNFILPYITTDTNDISDGQDGLLDFAHLAATLECYISSVPPHFWAGWGGDLATAMAKTTEEHTGNPNKIIQVIADESVGAVDSPFNYSDMCADADAIEIATLINASNSTTNPLSDAINTYYTTYVQNRYSYFVDDIDCLPNLTSLKEKIHDKMNGVAEQVLLAMKGGNPSAEVNVACCNAFANYIYSELI
jgi:hypothetical protein